MIGLTKVAALDYGAKGVRVNAVCPGTARTPMVDQALADFPALDAHLRALHPIGRIGEASEVAEAAVWLCTPAASFVLGVALPGGRRIRGAVRTTATSATVARLARQGHRIGGAWRTSDAGRRHFLHRYAATGRVQAELGLAGAADVDDAVAAARADPARVGGLVTRPTGRRPPSLGRPAGRSRRRGGRAGRPGQRDAGQRHAPGRTTRRPGSGTTPGGATSSPGRPSRRGARPPRSGWSPTGWWR